MNILITGDDAPTLDVTLLPQGGIEVIGLPGEPGPVGPQGPQGPEGPQGPQGAPSDQITVSDTPPSSPEDNDIWIDLS